MTCAHCVLKVSSLSCINCFFVVLKKKSMMKKLLTILSVCASIGMVAQSETITIDWSFNSVPGAPGNTNSSRTIEVGDTVTWNWYASGNHNVNSLNSANENFESTFMTTGTFSHTFQSVGQNPYQCDPHAGIMFGTITVVAEGTLNVLEQEAPIKFSMYPNPSAHFLNISLPNLSNQSLSLEVFDVLGKRVHSQELFVLNTKVNISKWNSGIYLVRLSSETATQTKRFVKQ